MGATTGEEVVGGVRPNKGVEDKAHLNLGEASSSNKAHLNLGVEEANSNKDDLSRVPTDLVLPVLMTSDLLSTARP